MVANHAFEPVPGLRPTGMELCAWRHLALNQQHAEKYLRRAGHTITAYDKYLYLVGGRSRSTFHGEIMRFDTEAQQWQRLPIKVPPRNGHVAVLMGRKLWVIGGAGKEGFHDDAWVLDLETLELTCAPIRCVTGSTKHLRSLNSTGCARCPDGWLMQYAFSNRLGLEHASEASGSDATWHTALMS